MQLCYKRAANAQPGWTCNGSVTAGAGREGESVVGEQYSGKGPQHERRDITAGLAKLRGGGAGAEGSGLFLVVGLGGTGKRGASRREKVGNPRPTMDGRWHVAIKGFLEAF